MIKSKLVKSIGNNRFEVELIEVESGLYCIKTNVYSREQIEFSEFIQDYKLASSLFDMKVQELEGN